MLSWALTFLDARGHSSLMQILFCVIPWTIVWLFLYLTGLFKSKVLCPHLLSLDQGLARSTVEYLREMGIESEHVGNLGMAASSDSEILDEGRTRGWVVVTLDADFHALLALSEASSPSVIRIRIEGMKGDLTGSKRAF